MSDSVMVSIICNAYNQENYVRDALESFVRQKTDFPFEILIHDDASTDCTAEIIREYEKKYPDVIKPIYETENQWSKHDGSITKIQMGRARGKYIALCEGDDFWTDPLKLQKQVDAMEAHPELDICAHAAKMVEAESLKPIKIIAPKKENCVIPPEEVIEGEGDYVATNSLLYRTEIERSPREFAKAFRLDYSLQIEGALRGGMLYLKDEMSVYRFMAKGSWTSMQKAGSAAGRHAHLEKKNNMLREVVQETGGKYSDIIEKRIRKNYFLEALQEKDMDGIFREEYREFFMELDPSVRGILRLERAFPFLERLAKKTSKS